VTQPPQELPERLIAAGSSCTLRDIGGASNERCATASARRATAGNRKRATGAPFYEAKWRYRGRQCLRRVGPAWLAPSDDGGWKLRRGRLPEDHFDEKRATVRMAAMIEEDAITIQRTEADMQAVLDRAVSFREVTGSWLEWLREVKGAKPSTARSRIDAR
jgi:hypothetical protein